MAKEIVFKPRVSTKEIRNRIKFYYNEKFFNKWMNKYDYPELNYQQKHYIMKKFWCEGTIACSKIEEADNILAGLIDSGEIDMKENKIIFTPWAFANRYNIYDFPTHARLINQRGVKFITQRILEIDKEVVIGYAQKNHKSVYSSIQAKIEELVDVEMKKRIARKAQAQPWLFAFSPEDYNKVKNLHDQLENDEPYLFNAFEEVDKIKNLSSSAPYIVDKLEQDRQKIENDILTMLGVNNVGIGEKKEHLIVDEVNANNQDVKEMSVSYLNEIKDFFDRVYKVLGYKVSVIDNNEYMESFEGGEEDVEESEMV